MCKMKVVSILVALVLGPALAWSAFASVSRLFVPLEGVRRHAAATEFFSITLRIDQEILQGLRLGRLREISLPSGAETKVYTGTGRSDFHQTVIWQGQAADGSRCLLCLGRDHLFGRVESGGRVIEYEPGGTSGLARMSRRDPAMQMPLGADFVPVPAKLRGTDRQGAPRAAGPLDQGDRIDVGVLYTTGMAQAWPGDQIFTRIAYLGALANQSFSNSAIQTQLRLVFAVETDSPDDTPINTALYDLQANSAVFALRQQYGADQVVLLRRFVEGVDACGIGYVLTGRSWEREYAYAVVHDGARADGYYCLDLTYAHEIGHNLGCLHDRGHDNSNSGRDPWSHGFQDPGGSFRTVMSYNCPGGCPRISYYSNPAVSYNGKATGVWYLDAASADCARTINESRKDMAGYMATVVPLNGSGASTVAPRNYLLLK